MENYLLNENKEKDVDSLSALHNMSFDELKKMRNYSHRIYALGIWWFLMGLIKLLLGASAFESGSNNFGILLILLGAWSLLAGIGAFSRQTWGKILGGFLSILYLAGIPIGTILGILGMTAYDKGEKLFGKNRILNKEISFEYNKRKSLKTTEQIRIDCAKPQSYPMVEQARGGYIRKIY